MRNPQIGQQFNKKCWLKEKEKKSEGIWDLDQAGTEKAEHVFSGQP
ncbi:hypothetical protein T458_01120 [Brevibacillus panacihumi W25]|uniref:Uncharacterized protein n=1 Tax=Brevibacillus panacihumi W25 TaxID=1408254 RepID=V6MML5_9BACL|nr:hypothetical protein T458_01120 [Brevibacillus panacihumi W25]